MMQKFRVSSIDIKRCTMRVWLGWVNERSRLRCARLFLLLLLFILLPLPADLRSGRVTAGARKKNDRSIAFIPLLI